MAIVQYFKHRVAVTYTDGEVLTGPVVDYTVAGDNDPEEESIVIIPESGRLKGKEIIIDEHEIKNIKQLDD
ncbi:hypothetical protein IWT25_02164 [Secundilactobacillus pentosiphilus]|uniref:Uncharacterized protein n=1 Tax=Secundilactobacillus pentosiphilus TaxID=1714682 RepID=A0A1Z5IYJ0_9LACO|nr:hypothetical protein [Secundilactobacillus pentosiphilus]GAX06817.1 hypothetical protein IWT25_02164 [Secundilactobacillus pentosiphilus]